MGIRESKVGMKEVLAKAWILCKCGEKHLLFLGIDAPFYWCGDELRKLEPGDEVEYEEILPCPKE